MTRGANPRKHCGPGNRPSSLRQHDRQMSPLERRPKMCTSMPKDVPGWPARRDGNSMRLAHHCRREDPGRCCIPCLPPYVLATEDTRILRPWKREGRLSVDNVV